MKILLSLLLMLNAIYRTIEIYHVHQFSLVIEAGIMPGRTTDPWQDNLYS